VRVRDSNVDGNGVDGCGVDSDECSTNHTAIETLVCKWIDDCGHHPATGTTSTPTSKG
jgi:hypothetical protein